MDLDAFYLMIPFFSLFSEMWKSKKLRKKVYEGLKMISVEPLMFLFGAGVFMVSISNQFLFLDKICQVELGYSAEECKQSLFNDGPENNVAIKVHQSMANWNVYLVLLTDVPTVITMLFFGSWSDKHSRKIPLLVPLAAYILFDLCMILNVYFFNMSVYGLLLSHIPIAIAGSTVLGALSLVYVMEFGTMKTKTIKMVLVLTFERIGQFCTKYTGGQMFKAWGYYSVYIASILIILLGIIYGVVRIKDPPRQQNNRKGLCKQLKELANVKTFVDGFKLFLVDRPNKGKMFLWLLLVSELKIIVSGSGNCILVATLFCLSFALFTP